MARPYPTHSRLSNLAADLAERAGTAFRAGRGSARHAAEAYLSAGQLLVELKAECAHGQWKDALERAGIPYRSAARLMQIARSGMDAATLADLGLKAAATALARSRNVPPVALSDAEADPEGAKNATVAPLPCPKRTSLYARRKAAGQCVVCGAATGGPVRCPDHARIEADRRKARRALARMGETLQPWRSRIEEAAKAGKPLRIILDAATVKELVR